MITDWLKKEAAPLADKLVELSAPMVGESPLGGFGLKSRVVRLITLVRTAMYPHIYQDKVSRPEFLPTAVADCVQQAAILLYEMSRDVLCDACTPELKRERRSTDCNEIASRATQDFMNSLPEIARLLRTDIRAAFEGDPAARSEEEILLAYPAFEAISIHRLAHRLFELGVPLLPRMMSEYAHQLTGIDIHPGATIGESFFIDHGTGVVIGETCTIGNHVKLYQGVTLGAKSFAVGEDGILIKGIKRHPDIGNNVVIYAGATILGGTTRIGDRAVIGGNVWLTHSVEEGGVVYNWQIGQNGGKREG